MKIIDFNCDLGEGLGNEADIMPFISSCNIACGGHAGDTPSMRYTLRLAKKYGVKAGAHPSYPDRSNFGRKIIRIKSGDLLDSLAGQIHVLEQIASGLDIRLHHIKFHGALYHSVAHDPETAGLVVKMMERYFSRYYLYVPYPSMVSEIALQAGLRIKYEVFADRNYGPDFQLLSRSLPNSLILDQPAVLEHVGNIVRENRLRAVSGEWLPVKADTLCLHGDHPGARLLAPAIYQKLKEEGYRMQ